MKKALLFLYIAYAMVLFVWPVQAQQDSIPTNLTFLLPIQFDRVFLTSAPGANGYTQNRNPSRVKAFFFSLVLPGTGEYYSGFRKAGNMFLGTEAVLWAGFFSLRVYGNGKKQDYCLFASAHAGVNPSGKNHQYFVDIENYSSTIDYNNAKLQQRSPDKMYPEDEAHFWKWDSEASRKRYERLRFASDKAYNISLFMIGGIVVNHIISGIDAVRVARKKEKLNIQIGLTKLDGSDFAVSFIKQL